MGRSFGDDQPSGALSACAEMARQITSKVASVPGFVEASRRVAITSWADRKASVPIGLLMKYGNDAGHIDALSGLMAAALTADHETSLPGEAADGLRLTARKLSDTLLELTGPTA